jgi:4-oxalocrotonate tautomerase family enzyme
VPFVIVEMWEGRTVDQKRKLVRAITDAMVAHAGAKPDHLHVVIHDTPKESWGRAGVLSVDETKPAASEKPVAAVPATVKKVRGFGHMLLMVEDMDRSVAFYVDRLGFTVRPAKPLADGRPFVAFEQGIALVAGLAHGARQMDHIAFEVGEVRPLRDSLMAAGIEFFRDLHDGPYGLTVYVADPDGNKVELYQVGATA